MNRPIIKGTPLQKKTSDNPNDLRPNIGGNTLGLKDAGELNEWYTSNMDKDNFGYSTYEDFKKDWPKNYGYEEYGRATTMEGGPDYFRKVKPEKTIKLSPRPIEQLPTSEMGELLSIGATISEFTNFGLSSQSVSRIGHGGFGKLIVKFKNWSIQKFSRDTSMIYNAYIANKDLELIEKSALNQGKKNPFIGFSPKAVGRMLKGLVAMPDKSRKLTDPQMSNLRTWFWIQAPVTILWDFFIAGPWKLPGLASYVYGGVVGKSTRNFTSDLISLMFMPLNIAARLMMVGYWDEDEAERAFTYYLRRTMLGYAHMAMWDFFLAMIALGNDKPKKAIEKFPFPAPPAVTRLGREAGKRFMN